MTDGLSKYKLCYERISINKITKITLKNCSEEYILVKYIITATGYACHTSSLIDLSLANIAALPMLEVKKEWQKWGHCESWFWQNLHRNARLHPKSSRWTLQNKKHSDRQGLSSTHDRWAIGMNRTEMAVFSLLGSIVLMYNGFIAYVFEKDAQRNIKYWRIIK